jgi:hypothetical protein
MWLSSGTAPMGDLMKHRLWLLHPCLRQECWRVTVYHGLFVVKWQEPTSLDKIIHNQTKNNNCDTAHVNNQANTHIK